MSTDIKLAIHAYIALLIVCVPLAAIFYLSKFDLWPLPLFFMAVYTFWGCVAMVWIAIGKLFPWLGDK